jgi:hypothetical protein
MYLRGLGVVFADLPRQGQNLRLYTYDPPGTQYYSPSGYVYNTGHYDATLPGGPCSMTDAQGFQDSASMNAYAGARGEILVLVSRNDLSALCAYRPAVQPAVLAPTAPAPAGSPIVSAPTGGDSGSISVILRGGTSTIAQPGTPGMFTAPTPSQPLDTGSGQAPAPPPAASDNTLVYAAIGLGVLLLAGRRRAA